MDLPSTPLRSLIQSLLVFLFFWRATLSTAAECNVKSINSSFSVTFNDIARFNNFTCALCYHLLTDHSFKAKTRTYDLYYVVGEEDFAKLCMLNRSGGGFADPWKCHLANYDTLRWSKPERDPILQTIAKEFVVDLFKTCCHDAMDCCSIQSNQKPIQASIRSEIMYCPDFWDGWTCWFDAAAGTEIARKCPLISYYYPTFLPEKCLNEKVYQSCQLVETNNDSQLAVWQSEPNYVNCLYPGADQMFRLLQFDIAILSVSMVLVFVALTVILFLELHRELKYQIHLNFFFSILWHCSFSICFKLLAETRNYDTVDRFNFSTSNPVWCKTLQVLRKIGKVTIYGWMLNEGLYLHGLIVTPFKKEIKTKYYYLIGYAIPMTVIIIYILLHSSTESDVNCWFTTSPTPDLVYAFWPMLVLTVNLLLLINVGRVLFHKLNDTSEHFKTGLKALLIMLPIFGVQHIFHIVSIYPIDLLPESGCNTDALVLIYIESLVESLQGSLVATIFFFVNVDVQNVARKLIWGSLSNLGMVKS